MDITNASIVQDRFFDKTEDDCMKSFRQFVSDEVREVMVVIFYIGLGGTIGFFGLIGNIVNLIAFARQGFDNTVNISLAGIAVSDACSLLSLMWFNVLLNPLFERSEEVMVSSEIQYLTAGWPHIFFARITCWITVYITVERCLCVVIPLTVKKIITKPRTICIVIFLFIAQFATVIPSYYTTYIDWKFFPQKNRSLLGIYRIDNFEKFESIGFVLQSAMQVISFVMLIFFTAMLLIAIKRKTKWRQNSTSGVQKQSISTREKKLVRMVVLIAIILIVCFTPGVFCFTAMIVEPELSIDRAYNNLFYVIWAFAFPCQTFNSSVNIFVYYNMSSNYRNTFNEMFAGCRKIVGLNDTDEQNN